MSEEQEIQMHCLLKVLYISNLAFMYLVYMYESTSEKENQLVDLSVNNQQLFYHFVSRLSINQLIHLTI